MSMWARLKGIAGGDSGIAGKTVAAATTLNIPDDLSVVPLTGTATVTSLVSANQIRGRMVWFFQSDTGATTFTNSPGTTTAGQMDLGALDPANVVLAASDWLCLYLKPDNTWIKVFGPTNN